ncbi:PglL family O-oligosaccharyltransferase [Roseateles violae]|uniref:Wzy polymerase domain-containing protein n=1 Tax=Roseateles violae TaxID=3058042 RepID=A0ABT8DKK0_9BURK|nr:O-antigen ligase family protein [Pelomonas sp. PFR6]MDN3918927.1 Wzy polymerase domain-containing protein [Pelomonas sp. PFR6]
MPILLIAPWASLLREQLPLSLVLSSSALLAAALLLQLAGSGLRSDARRAAFEALCWGLLAAGLLSLLVSLIQVFLPEVPDGHWIARSGIPGRAVGSMRQPNHLASLLMWACVATVYLVDAGRLGAKAERIVLPALLFGFVFAIVLSASRTGMLGVLMLAAWGGLDRKLQRGSRLALLATPLMLALAWWGVSAWASAGHHAFGAESRLAEGAGSPSRLAILANAWELLKRNPWLGVGWGEFNLAWTMTPFPNRPIAFFDHTHNLPMQLAVELGLPLSLTMLALLGWALWWALRASMRASGSDAVVRRCAVLLVLTIGLHSLLEYPLWYAYFLMPAAFAFGIALAPLEPAPSGGSSALKRLLGAGGALLLAGSLFAVWDYLQVVAIYVPPEEATPLSQRIAVGQRSLFFSTQADYAAATTLPPGPQALAATQRTAHNLIDARLMVAWARSLHAVGDDDRARYVVQRLREFRGSEYAQLTAECEAPPAEAKAVRSFQCDPPQRDYEWREMRR